MHVETTNQLVQQATVVAEMHANVTSQMVYM